jgi:INO80 complex subunit C
MAPSTPGGDGHQTLLDSLDIALKPRPWRNARWKPSPRRNKNIKQIIGEAARREASVMATQNNSGNSTPAQQSTRAGTPSAESNGGGAPSSAPAHSNNANIAQAARNLSTLVLERNLQASLAANGTPAGGDTGPVATYTNIEAAPSLNPAQQKHYCDITGLPAPYTDPKTRLRYHDKEVFNVIRTLPPGVAEQYLAARGANVILK